MLCNETGPINTLNKQNDMKTIACIIGIMVAVTSCTSPDKSAMDHYRELHQEDAPNTLAASEKEEGWKLLFDGNSPGAWRGYNMDSIPGGWIIEDGAFKVTTEGKGENLGIITDEEYGRFALSLECKLTEGANSGLIYQVKEDTAYRFPYETGPEFQILDHVNWSKPIEKWQIMGANYAMYPPQAEPFREIGEWNHLVLVVDGNTVTQILNGEVVVEYEKYSDDWNERRNSGKWEKFPDWGKFDTGHIALQNHGSVVWFRDIKIKELD